MVDNKSEEITKIYGALSHPLRKRIVELIGQKSLAGFKDLKDTLEVSVGTIYYHLEMLEDLITQNEEKKYILTNKGKLALKFLSSSEEQLRIKTNLEKRKASVFSSFIQEIVFLRKLYSSLTSNPLRYIPEILIIMGFGAWIYAQTEIEPLLLFYNNQPTFSSSIGIMVEFIASWLIIFGLCEILSIVFFQRRGGETALLTSTALSLFPLLILPTWLYVNDVLNLGLVIDWIWVNVFLLFFQAWILCLLTAAVGFSKGLKLEKAALIGLIVMYFNICILFLLIRGF